MNFYNYDYIIVGAGLYGSVIAERLANKLGKKVLIIEKRNHIGGNCYSQLDDQAGIEYHVYGTHIFHTSNPVVWEYVNRFTTFNNYNHQVLTTHKSKVYQMPINLETINSYYGLNLKPYEVDSFLKDKIDIEKIQYPKNFEEKAISLVGRELYNAFIKGYTEKQWQVDLKKLPAEILMRLPFRKNYDESYYHSKWQGIPEEGYAKVFKNILNHKNIHVKLNTDYFEIRNEIPKDISLIYSGPVDKFFNYKFGKLEWRSLTFEKAVIDVEDFQGTSVMNYADVEIPYTRIHEPKHLHPERKYTKNKTLIVKEYSKTHNYGDEYYPINTTKNINLLKKYAQLITSKNNILLGGRLGDYKYYDMHQTIEAALKVFDEIIQKNERISCNNACLQ